MVEFWSYKQEYNKYNKQILKIIDKTLKKGSVFFSAELDNFEKNLSKNIEQIMESQLVVEPKL